jgi:Na+/proline symporter
LLLGIRRGAIVVILLLGYLYFRLAGDAYALVAIGLISFSAVAQFAPAMIGGMYWRGGTRDGALAGLRPVFWSGPTRCCCRRFRNPAGFQPAF